MRENFGAEIRGEVEAEAMVPGASIDYRYTFQAKRKLLYGLKLQLKQLVIE